MPTHLNNFFATVGTIQYELCNTVCEGVGGGGGGRVGVGVGAGWGAGGGGLLPVKQSN